MTITIILSNDILMILMLMIILMIVTIILMMIVMMTNCFLNKLKKRKLVRYFHESMFSSKTEC